LTGACAVATFALVGVGNTPNGGFAAWLVRLLHPRNSGAADRPRGAQPTILVADDEISLRSVARVTLEAQGWSVIEAATPEACIQMAVQHRPEVVLLDVNFAGSQRDGYSICRELITSSETKDIRVVLFTARDDPESRAFASAVGARAFIVKPFGPFELVAILRLVREHPEGEPALGLYLVEEGLIRPHQLERALAEQHLRQGEHARLGEVLVELGFVTGEQVASALERQRRRRPLTRDVGPVQGRLRVLIADDNPSVRQALRELVEPQTDLNLVGVAVDGAEALRMARESRPDVVILDNDMPRLSGLDVLKTIKTSMPEMVVLMFTLDDSIGTRALELGAADVMTKDMPLDTVLAQIRRLGPPLATAAAPSKLVVMTRAASNVAWGTLLRTRQAITLIAVLVVAYAGAFLLAEPWMGASAAVLATIVVAIGGAVLGPEIGMMLAIAFAAETAALWMVTGHVVGEPIIRVGGNGAGVIALIGIGAGFGGMRALRGRIRPRDRQVSALAQAALIVSGGLTPSALNLLAEAALEVVPGDSVLLFVRVPGGGLELVARAGHHTAHVGARALPGAIATAYLDRRTRAIDHVIGRSLGIAVPGAASALVVPILGPGGASGVIVALAKSSSAYQAAHERALEVYASFLAALLSSPPAVMALETNQVAVAHEA
jgi:DNA-binding NarL/FixJ family response regulator